MSTATLPTAENTTPIMTDKSNGNGTSTTTPVVVTSGASRTGYADNVNTLSQANQSIAGAVNPNGDRTNVTADGYTFNGQNYVKQTRYDGNGSPYTVDVISGTSNNGSKPNTQQNTPSNVSTSNTGTDTSSSSNTPVNPFAPNASGSAVTGSTANTDGSQTVNYADGTKADFIHDAQGNLTPKDGSGSPTANVTTGNMSLVDPSLRAAYDKNNADLTQQANDAKSAVAQAVATMQNDPAALAAASNIQRQFDVLIRQMQEKNNMILGGYKVGQARSGMLQYANEMSSNFMSMEMDKATQRIADLHSKELDAINRSNEAYKNKDVAALKAATASYNNILKEKQKNLTDLNKLVNDAVKNNQAQAKADAAASKQQITDDIRVSASLGKSIADEIRKSGVTDETQINDYITAVAEQNGISNPEILRSAYVKEDQNASKLDLSAKNTNSIITRRDNTPIKGSGGKGTTYKGGKDGAYIYTANDVSAYANLFNKGGKDSQGTVFAPRGADGFVDPGAYTAAYNDWKGNGGTPKGFMKQFPVVTNVNPASYSKLPAALQPKAKTTGTTKVIPE